MKKRKQYPQYCEISNQVFHRKSSFYRQSEGFSSRTGQSREISLHALDLTCDLLLSHLGRELVFKQVKSVVLEPHGCSFSKPEIILEAVCGVFPLGESLGCKD